MRNCKSPEPIDTAPSSIVELIKLASQHDWNWMMAEHGGREATERESQMQRLANVSADAERIWRALRFWHNSTPPEVARGDHEQRWRSLLREHRYHEYAAPGKCQFCARRVQFIKAEIQQAHRDLGQPSWVYLAKLSIAGRDVMWNPATRAAGFFPLPRGVPSY